MKKIKNELIIHSIDNTVGDINHKIAKFRDEKNEQCLQYQMLRIMFKTSLKVSWKHSFLAPAFKVNTFNQIKHQEEFQISFAEGKQAANLYSSNLLSLNYGICCP